MHEIYVLYIMKIILSTFLRLKYGIKIYVSPIYFLIDFDMERKVCTFYYYHYFFLNKGRKVLLLEMIQTINMKRVFPLDENCNLRKKFIVRLISHPASYE